MKGSAYIESENIVNNPVFGNFLKNDNFLYYYTAMDQGLWEGRHFKLMADGRMFHVERER